MKLEFVPVKEAEGARKVPKRRGILRLYWIVWDSADARLSGGYTLGASPL